MIETIKADICQLLRNAGEPVADEDSFMYTRLGEGRGFSSLLWRVNIGRSTYAVKVTDTVSRVDEIAKMVNLEEDQKAGFARLFGEQHNRELQVYEWFKHRGCHNIPAFYAGKRCEDGEPGIIIMECFGPEFMLKPDQGLDLPTVHGIIDTITTMQAASLYPDADEKIDLIPKDLFFEMASPTYKKCIEKVAANGWLNEEWESVLLSWCEIPELKRIQSSVEEGDPPLVLAHCDLWANNLIFAPPNDKVGLYLHAIVDWQCAAMGNALLDVSSVVGINLDAEERRKHEDTFLGDYTAMINEKCDFTKYPNAFVISTEQTLKLYKRGLKFAAIQLSLALGTHCKDEAQEKALTARLRAIMEDIAE